MNLADFDPGQGKPDQDFSVVDRWILSRYQHAAGEVTRHLSRYDVGEGARVLYDFIWSELCDWYIELVKPRLYGHHGDKARRASQYALWYFIRNTMQLLHPYMPFITEEIWQQLPLAGETIMLAPWPVEVELRDEAAEEVMELLMAVITSIRTIRSEKQVPPGRKITAILKADPELREILEANSHYLQALAGLASVSIDAPGDTVERSVAAVTKGVEIYLPLADLVDLEAEAKRIANELAKAETELERVKGKLANPGFVTKAPEAVVAKEREKLELLTDTVAKLTALYQEIVRE